MKKILTLFLIMFCISPVLTSCNSDTVENTTNGSEITEESYLDKTFTKETLSEYNGKNGKAAYIAVDGIVYDVSNHEDWKDGEHKGVYAGNDLTDAFNGQHEKSILDNLPKVGVLK